VRRFLFWAGAAMIPAGLLMGCAGMTGSAGETIQRGGEAISATGATLANPLLILGGQLVTMLGALIAARAHANGPLTQAQIDQARIAAAGKPPA